MKRLSKNCSPFPLDNVSLAEYCASQYERFPMRLFGHSFILSGGCLMFGAVATAIAESPGLTAQIDAAIDESFASWVLRRVGLFGVLTLLAGLISLVGVCVVVFRARGPVRSAWYFLSLPILMGIFGTIAKCLSTGIIVAKVDAEMAPLYIAGAASSSVAMLEEAVIVTIPSVIAFAVGVMARRRRGGIKERNPLE
jgi:hypothetical protein